MQALQQTKVTAKMRYLLTKFSNTTDLLMTYMQTL